LGLDKTEKVVIQEHPVCPVGRGAMLDMTAFEAGPMDSTCTSIFNIPVLAENSFAAKSHILIADCVTGQW
jgi:hypothetical protein